MSSNLLACFLCLRVLLLRQLRSGFLFPSSSWTTAGVSQQAGAAGFFSQLFITCNLVHQSSLTLCPTHFSPPPLSIFSLVFLFWSFQVQMNCFYASSFFFHSLHMIQSTQSCSWTNFSIPFTSEFYGSFHYLFFRVLQHSIRNILISIVFILLSSFTLINQHSAP